MKGILKGFILILLILLPIKISALSVDSDLVSVNKMGVDVEKLTNANGDKLAEDEGLWFYTSSRNQLNSVAAEDQDVLVEGIKDAILTMIYSEPSDGAGYSVPYWMQ